MLRTARLILRNWRPEDFEPWAALNADPEVMRHFPATLTRVEADAMAARNRDHIDQHGFGLWAVERREDGAFLGFTGLMTLRESNPLAPGVEAGWRQAADDAEAFGDKAHASFACAAGVAITVKDTPTLSRMLDRMTVDAGQSVGGAKMKYNRPRPLVGHDDAPVCVPREAWMQTNPSYPSSSAAAGWAWALVLAELLPRQATPIITRGLAAGESRAICGVHWPSDVTAGRTMGAALVARLHADPAFLKDLETAKAELAAAPPPEGCGG